PRPAASRAAPASWPGALWMPAPRRVCKSAFDARAGKWKTWEPLGYLGQDLAGKTLGIVGMGRIGYAMAKRGHGGWDMKILYFDEIPSVKAEADFGAKRVELPELLRESDFV